MRGVKLPSERQSGKLAIGGCVEKIIRVKGLSSGEKFIRVIMLMWLCRL